MNWQFPKGWKNQQQKELSIHFLFISLKRKTTLTSFVHNNNIIFEYLKEQFLSGWCAQNPYPSLWCIAKVCWLPLDVYWISFPESFPSWWPQALVTAEPAGVNGTPDCLMEFFPQSKILTKSIDCISISWGSIQPTYPIVCLITKTSAVAILCYLTDALCYILSCCLWWKSKWKFLLRRSTWQRNKLL